MPRANRYILPGRTCHLTHRCHNRSFLFRFARDRTEYCRRLRLAVREFRISLLGYCITSNHTHLLIRAGAVGTISAFMQKLEGEFAEYYNLRKRRSGAFWGGRFHGAMIDSGEYLRNCMRYIDLNMVRAGVVEHPRAWRWCGYHELVGERQRYRLLDVAEVLRHYGEATRESFVLNYRAGIEQSLAAGKVAREPLWTESIAVGTERFVRDVGEETRNRLQLDVVRSDGGAWVVREAQVAYDSFSGSKSAPKPVPAMVEGP